MSSACLLKIKLRSYSVPVVDQAAMDIVKTAKDTGAVVSGPVPLPSKVKRFVVLKSPHGDKKSREKYHLTTHQRLIVIKEMNDDTMKRLNVVGLNHGVEVIIGVGN